MATTRKRLTEKQFRIYVQARDKARQLLTASDAAQAELRSIGELILDAHGIESTNVTIDDATHELVIVTDEESDHGRND